MNFEIIHLETVDSTNKFALDFAETSAIKNGLVIWADEQTAGRGHGENSWESKSGKNLTFTLVIKPLYISPARQFTITQMVSVALQNTLEKFTGRNDIRIKWPNDIYAGNKKLAGMLIQNVIKGEELDLSVIGIGLNVNQQQFNLRVPNPVSIIHLIKKETERKHLLQEFLKEFQNEYEKSGSPLFQEMIGKSYFEKMYLFNEWANYKAGDEIIGGKIKGVGPYGHLILVLENGEERQFGFKEVELIIE
jgi:BirA family biotin operon repressor/biotin-[acetyl-CoA-carboxylase] ligase